MTMKNQKDLIELGLQPMFATQESMEEAQKYLEMVAKGTENPMATITAAIQLLNTYIKVRYDEENKNEPIH